MSQPKIKYLTLCVALAVMMACVLPGVQSPPPSFATIDPNLIGTIVVMTGNAASSQTAVALPSHTSTVTFTPTRATDTPEPTATATVLLQFFSPTPKIQIGNAGSSNQPYACNVLGVTPPNGKVFAPRTDFDAKWKVQNMGTKEWEANSVDYVYLDGDKFHKVDGYDLKKTVKLREITELIVDMVAPKDTGSYATNWTLRVGNQKFCTLSLTIVVR